jgi:preprotein translocase subunit SecF
MRSSEARIARHTADVLAARSGTQPTGEGAAPGALAAAASVSGQVVPGQHLGTAAQPRRKRTTRR